MKRLLYVLIICAIWGACSDDDMPEIHPTSQGTFTDERDGNTYGWVRIGDLEWMTSNFKYGTPYYENEYGGALADGYGDPSMVTSWDTDFDFEADLEEYGNLYSWEEAVEYAPEGWRLPTDEDWKALEMTLGMSVDDANATGWRGGQEATLMRQSEEGTGLALQLGGQAHFQGFPSYLYIDNIGVFGCYWSATENEDNGLENMTVFFRKIFATYSTVYRGDTPVDQLMRVRYVRDAQ